MKHFSQTSNLASSNTDFRFKRCQLNEMKARNEGSYWNSAASLVADRGPAQEALNRHVHIRWPRFAGDVA